MLPIKSNDAPQLHPEPGMVRQVLAHSPHLMLIRHTLEEGWVGAAHSHPHHQLLYVVSGCVRLTLPDGDFTLSRGDSIVIDGGVQHQAAALLASEVLNVFTPIREDYKP